MTETLGDRLQIAMKRANLKNPAVAAALGVHHGTVSAWRGDAFPPSEENVEALAKLLGVTAQWLRYGDDVQTSSGAARLRAGEYDPSWPEGWRERTYRLVAEAVEAGATEEEIAVVRGWMLDPQLQTIGSGGAGKADRLNEIEALERGARAWLIARGRKVKSR